METTGGDAFWLNGKNERHNRSIQNMVRSRLLDSNQHEKNGAVQKKYQKNFIYVEYTVVYTISHLTLHSMEQIPASMNL